MAKKMSKEDREYASREADRTAGGQATTRSTKEDEKKAECPYDLEEFLKLAQPVTLDLGGRKLSLNPKKFSTGSFGWAMNDKVEMEVDGKKVRVQAGINLVVIGSK